MAAIPVHSLAISFTVWSHFWIKSSLSSRSRGGYPGIQSSEKIMRSDPASFAFLIALQIKSLLPVKLPI